MLEGGRSRRINIFSSGNLLAVNFQQILGTVVRVLGEKNFKWRPEAEEHNIVVVPVAQDINLVPVKPSRVDDDVFTSPHPPFYLDIQELENHSRLLFGIGRRFEIGVPDLVAGNDVRGHPSHGCLDLPSNMTLSAAWRANHEKNCLFLVLHESKSLRNKSIDLSPVPSQKRLNCFCLLGGLNGNRSVRHI